MIALRCRVPPSRLPVADVLTDVFGCRAAAPLLMYWPVIALR